MWKKFHFAQLYCFEVLHNHLLEILITYLNECIVNIQHDPTQWTQLEACIYAIYSIAEHIETDEVVGVPKFIITLSEIPYDKLHEKLLGTALDSIGMKPIFFFSKVIQFLSIVTNEMI